MRCFNGTGESVLQKAELKEAQLNQRIGGHEPTMGEWILFHVSQSLAIGSCPRTR